MSSETTFGYRPKNPKPYFIVKNITHLKGEPKVIKIFNYPINPERPEKNIIAGERDLLEIPGISVDDIEISLMSGTLKHKILSKDIYITKSNIELIQFDENFKNFLKNSGITVGVEVTAGDGYVIPISQLSYIWRKSQKLIGVKDGINRLFYTSEPFLNGLIPSGDMLYIEIFHNGKRLIENINYTIGKTSILLEGYDLITFISPIPIESSEIEVNYAIKN